MLGFYDYTVILTYLSVISACLGITVSLNGPGHPYYGMFFLLFCGFCDAFDGKVARTKKNRTEQEKKFGIQIDSMSDLLAFGVLPACIGNAMIRVSPTIEEIPRFRTMARLDWSTAVILWVIILMYMLAALIRLSYFNVMEEERQQKEAGNRKVFDGLPVTSSALIFPTVLLLQYVTHADITIAYFIAMALTGFAFISPIRVPKPGTKGILFMVAFGLVEFALLGFLWVFN